MNRFLLFLCDFCDYLWRWLYISRPLAIRVDLTIFMFILCSPPASTNKQRTRIRANTDPRPVGWNRRDNTNGTKEARNGPRINRGSSIRHGCDDLGASVHDADLNESSLLSCNINQDNEVKILKENLMNKENEIEKLQKQIENLREEVRRLTKTERKDEQTQTCNDDDEFNSTF